MDLQCRAVSVSVAVMIGFMMSKHVHSGCIRAALPLDRWRRMASVIFGGTMVLPMAYAQDEARQLPEVVVSVSRAEQRRFDAPAAIDAVQVDPFRSASPLVNLSELLSTVPGIQVRE